MEMKVLGSWIQNDGGIDTCFTEAVGKAWKAFFANCAGAKAEKLPIALKLALVGRAALPILGFKWTRWPFTVSKAQELDAVQRRMYTIILRLRPAPDQTIASFVRFRGRKVADLQRTRGPWSKMWAHAIWSWDSHLKRGRNASTRAAMVAAMRPPEELAERRAAFGSPLTRSAPGFIRRRWFESILVADEWSKQ